MKGRRREGTREREAREHERGGAKDKKTRDKRRM
jgi:hypothetical protein